VKSLSIDDNVGVGAIACAAAAPLPSESTVDRIEAGHDCRMETKRKILFALGLTIQESGKLFPRHNGATRQRAGGE